MRKSSGIFRLIFFWKKRGQVFIFTTLFVTTLFMNFCSNLFYYPSKERFIDPAQLGLKHENIYFESSDGIRLHGWFFPATSPAEEVGVVVQFHGNAENISTHFSSLVWLVEHGYSLFTFDYRGYGQSGGSINQEKIIEDALAAINYVVQLNASRSAKNTSDKEPKRPKIILYGQSIGGITLLKAWDDFKEKDLINAIIIDSSFSSYQEIAREKLSLSPVTWLFQPIAYLLISDRYAPTDSIRNVSPVPLLVIHGDHDDVVPLHHGKKIFDLAGEPKWFWEIKGGSHIDSMTSHKEFYRKKLLQFLEGR